MTTDKRKEQFRKANKLRYINKKQEGRVNFKWLIFPEWRKRATDFFNSLEREKDNERTNSPREDATGGKTDNGYPEG